MSDDPQVDEPATAPTHPANRARRWWLALVVVVAVAVLGVGLGLGLSSANDGAPVGPEGVALQQVPDLAPVTSTATGAPVDGITCRTTAKQKVGYHVHTHVAIFVNGNQVRIPAGAGIAAPRLAEHESTGVFYDNSVLGCLYWLHVHANDGVIHVEAPAKQTFTLGQFFDIWGQPLSPTQVGPATGTVVAFVNGTRFTGNPRDVPLLKQGVIQLDVGSPVVPFQAVHFTVSGSCGPGGTCHPTGEHS